MLIVAHPFEKAKKSDEIAWILDRVRRNIAENTQTCIMSTYHTITKDDLSDLFDNKLVFYVDIIHDESYRLISERNFVINDNLLDISVFISGIIDSSKENMISIDIICTNFSALIHNLGQEEVFRCLTHKNPEFDDGVNLIVLINPKSHPGQVWEQFKNLAREVIEIRGDKK